MSKHGALKRLARESGEPELDAAVECSAGLTAWFVAKDAEREAMTDDELKVRFPLVEVGVGVRHRVAHPSVSEWATHDALATMDGLEL